MQLFALFGTIALLGFSAAAGAATAGPDCMAPVRVFVGGFNKGDMKAGAQALSPAGLSNIDDVPPHVWAGPNALDSWSKALAASDQATGSTDEAVKLGQPPHVVVSADRRYVVLPAGYTLKAEGVAVREPDRVVVGLPNGPSGWQ